MQFKVIFALFTKKSSIEQLVDNYSNILIRTTKAINVGVIRIKALEHWQRLKIYIILLVRYLGERKIELFCQEIELSIEIQLKTVPY